MGVELSAIVFGLASAVCWGAGDFSGGLATRRNSVYSVIIIAELFGTVLLVALAILHGENALSPDGLYWGVLAGWSGTVGLVALYRGLSTGRMGIVAPVSALVSGIVPVFIGITLEGLPAIQQFIGFGLALVAVWFISRESDGGTIQLHNLRLPVIAGLGFGFYYVFIDRMSEGGVFLPLAASRISSMALLAVVMMVYRQRDVPARNHLPIIIVAGLFDAGGNTFFTLASQTGRLDVTAVLASLYPAATVLLAWVVLKEKLNRQQWIGVITALAAVALIASNISSV